MQQLKIYGRKIKETNCTRAKQYDRLISSGVSSLATLINQSQEIIENVVSM